ncbi:MAG: hypothetical protein ABWZ40_09435 [Caulobacterales bacterium]
MTIQEQIPSLSDDALLSLFNNATRLAQSGSDKQRAQAEELLPQIGAALDERKEAQRQRAEEKRQASVKKRTAKPRATAAAALEGAQDER